MKKIKFILCMLIPLLFVQMAVFAKSDEDSDADSQTEQNVVKKSKEELLEEQVEKKLKLAEEKKKKQEEKAAAKEKAKIAKQLAKDKLREKKDNYLGVVYAPEKTYELKRGKLRITLKGSTGSFNIYARGEDTPETAVLTKYDGSSSSYFSAKIGSTSYRLNQDAGVTRELRKLGTGAQLAYTVEKKVQIVVGFEPISSVLGATEDLVRVTVYMTNISKTPSDIAIKALFDTILGEGTDYHFITSTGVKIKGEKQFAAFADACIEAEKSISASPALCALGVRKSAELAVKWLYSVDRSLRMPYKDNFSALVYNQSFIDSIDEDILDRLKFIIKLGNFSAHTSTKVTYKEAVLSLANLFDFILFIDYCYGENYQERIFDESLLAADNNQKISAEELDRLQKELEDRSKEREQMAEEMKKLQDQLEEMRRQNEQKRHYSANEKTEEETRKSIIDVDIKSMGWTIGNNCIEEYPVVGMPDTPTGTGSVDYVLFSHSHKPLAVLEAKRTTRDAKEGQHQAWLYANCLEQMTGFRPLIFYTNGYTTWLWDDLNYSERKVYSVFSRQDMQRIIDRREIQKDFRQLNINPEITDRPYQKMAIQSVCSDFSKKKRKALLVMATGTGKTRVSISLVDVLQDHRWITNILFLADRVELVKQAKKAFVRHLPNLSTCNLLERGDDKPTDRAIFSTYPTIMNAINDEKTDDGQKLFTPGHFDLIIVDEAHRSIFKKYRAIFEYFDALLVGLTATPKKDVGHNTYDFFDLEDDMPTYAYEYAEARDAGWLADYHSVEKLFKIPTEGINPDNLTDEQRQELEDSYDISKGVHGCCRDRNARGNQVRHTGSSPFCYWKHIVY